MNSKVKIRFSTNFMTLLPNLTFTDYEWFPWSICKGCGMPAGNAYPSGHLVPSPIVGLACAPIVETRFLELAMSLLDFSPRIPLGPFSILLRLRLVRSVLRASNFPCLKFIEIAILWVYYTIPFGFTLFGHFWAYIFNFLNYFLWLRITDEGSVPGMRIWSISLIQSDLKWCIHLSRSLF